MVVICGGGWGAGARGLWSNTTPTARNRKVKIPPKRSLGYTGYHFVGVFT